MNNDNGDNIQEDLNSLVQLTLRKIDIHVILQIIRTHKNLPGELIDNIYAVKQILQNAMMVKTNKVETKNG
jgi:hypothetical protein